MGIVVYVLLLSIDLIIGFEGYDECVMRCKYEKEGQEEGKCSKNNQFNYYVIRIVFQVVFRPFWSFETHKRY